MTQERLRELLRERVADETMPDVSGPAWQAARVVRRRRRLGAAAGVVAVTVGVSGGIAAWDSTPPAPEQPGLAVSDPTHRPALPDATYHGVPVWWSPDQREEQGLEPVSSPLPAEIELEQARNGLPDDDMDRALAVFEQGRTITLVGAGGAMRFVPVSQVHDVTKPNGYSYFPPPRLSPDGTLVVFTQDGGRPAIYDVAGRTWSYDQTYDAAAPEAADPGFDTGSAQQYGEVHDGAASWGMGVDLPVRDPAVDLSGPEFVVTPGGVLAIMDRFSRGEASRYKNCCAVAGWLDPDTVVYESRQDESLLVAWTVGTDRFRLVSRIHGQYDASSFAF